MGVEWGEEMSQLGKKRTLVRAYTEFPFNKKIRKREREQVKENTNFPRARI